MPKKALKHWIPKRDQLAKNRSLQVLGDWIHDDNLWHLNRRSASLAVFIGIFVAFLPIPGQMIAAALLAVLLHCNLPIAVALVWITNPVTMPAIYYGSYKLGAFLLDVPARAVDFSLSWEATLQTLAGIWQPLLLGCLVCGIFFGSIGYGFILITWRLHVVRRWQERKRRRGARRAR